MIGKRINRAALCLGSAAVLAVLTGCPLWNRFADDVGMPGWQVAYRPPLRETDERPSSDPRTIEESEPIEIEAALTDDELAEDDTQENLGRAQAPGGERLPVLSRRALDSDLIVEVLRVGEGEVCKADSWVTLRCHGTLTTGLVFDDSGREGIRGPWKVSQLIPGLQQGIVGMRAGGVRSLTIPPALAYGEQAIFAESEEGQPLIPPDSTLLYAVELIEVFADAAQARRATLDHDEEADHDAASDVPERGVDD